MEGFSDNAGAGDVPARRESRLVEDEGRVGVCDDLVFVSHDEVAGAASDVDAVIGVGGVAEDALVLFIKGVHHAPGEREGVAQCRSPAGAGRGAAMRRV
jgi:hypothetical protein